MITTIQRVYELVMCLNEGETITSPQLHDMLPDCNVGAISGALYALSTCDQPLLYLVTKVGRAYLYSRTDETRGAPCGRGRDFMQPAGKAYYGRNYRL